MTLSALFRPVTAFGAAPVALLLAFAAPAFAQDAATPAAPAEGAAPVDGAAPSGLSMGTEVGPDGQPVAAGGPGTAYVEASFGAWEQRCVREADGSDPCQLYQLLSDEQGNAVAEFSLFNLPAGGEAVAGATLIVPLETLLTENVQMAIDGTAAKVYPFTFCSSIGCVARIGFTAAEIEQFKAGASARITIVPVVAPEERVTVTLSLSGFTAGYTAVSATNP